MATKSVKYLHINRQHSNFGVMNCKTLSHLIIVILSITLAGCNDDIFVSREPDRQTYEDEATIAGDGGTHTFTLQSTGLKSIEAVPYQDCFIYYFNHDGDDIASDSPVNEISRISYRLIGFELNIDIDDAGSTVTATCNENIIFDTTISIYLSLEYKYSTVTLQINVTPGTQAQLVDVEYDFSSVSPSYIPPVRQHTFNTTYNNPTDKPLVAGVNPKNYVTATAQLTTGVTWASNLSGSVKLPTFNGSSWSTTDRKEIQLGRPFNYIPARFETDEIVSVTVPPNESIRVTVTTNYIVAEIPIVLTIRSPFTDTQIWAYGNCKTTEPVSYEISTQTIQ